MRKIVIGSGLGLVAAAIPAHGAALPIAAEPIGVSEAGRVSFADQGTDSQGVLIGLNKPGATQIKQQGTATDKFKTTDSQVKMNPYDKMNAAAQLKIKGEYKFNKAGDSQIKTQDQIKSPGNSQIKMKSVDQQTFKSGAFKFGTGGGEGIVRPNCLQPGQ